MKITERVHTVATPPGTYAGGPPTQTPNIHIIIDGGEAAFVDSGFPDEASVKLRLDYLAQFPGVRLKYIFLTHHHFDHSSGADTYRKQTGAQIVCHVLEEPLIRNPREEAPQDFDQPQDQERAERYRQWREEAAKAVPDLTASDGDLFTIGDAHIRVVHTPGHTAGSACYLLEEEKVLFTGDTLLGLGTVAISPPPWGDMVQYMQSLHRLKEMDLALMCPGHGPTIQAPRRKVEELIAHRGERDRQILDCLAKGVTRVEDMVAAIYPELDKRLIPSARGQVRSHLYKLEVEGRVKSRQEGEETLYTLA